MDNQKKETIKKLFDSFDRFHKLDWDQSPVPELKRSEVFTLLTIKKIMDNKKASVKVTDISKALDVAPPTVTQLITGLEKKGYVERSLNKEDRRAVIVELTEKGLEAIEVATAVVYKYFEGLVEYLGEGRSNELAELINMVFNYFKGLTENMDNGGV